jgi:hypothetical protein
MCRVEPCVRRKSWCPSKLHGIANVGKRQLDDTRKNTSESCTNSDMIGLFEYHGQCYCDTRLLLKAGHRKDIVKRARVVAPSKLGGQLMGSTQTKKESHQKQQTLEKYSRSSKSSLATVSQLKAERLTQKWKDWVPSYAPCTDFCSEYFIQHNKRRRSAYLCHILCPSFAPASARPRNCFRSNIVTSVFIILSTILVQVVKTVG